MKPRMKSSKQSTTAKTLRDRPYSYSAEAMRKRAKRATRHADNFMAAIRSLSYSAANKCFEQLGAFPGHANQEREDQPSCEQ